MHLEIQVDPIPADSLSDNAASLTSIVFLDEFVTLVDTIQVPCLMDPLLGDLDVEAFISFHLVA